uniref:Uncharacterized protein n=1 Tax=Anguilla anguilla TaxID=7936 RepID=A0A0E9XIK1_ANGAN
MFKKQNKTLRQVPNAHNLNLEVFCKIDFQCKIECNIKTSALIVTCM